MSDGGISGLRLQAADGRQAALAAFLSRQAANDDADCAVLAGSFASVDLPAEAREGGRWFCSRVELRQQRDGKEWRKPVPCRCWRCARCARQLRRGVMALAAAGQPKRMLTLTVDPKQHETPAKAREDLHGTWRVLRRLVAKEHARPYWARWLTPAKRAARAATRRAKGLPADPRPQGRQDLPYFAVVEKHESGWPHLHVLLRGKSIPKRWLSAQMQRLAGAPVVDIRACTTASQAAGYVAKYIGKAPARFGKAKAYWYSKSWAPQPDGGDIEEPQQKTWFSVRCQRFVETLDEINHSRPAVHVTSDGWLHIDQRDRIGITRWYRGTYPPFRENSEAWSV